jgi:hypothetical protein
MMIRGIRLSRHRSMARAIFSPTAEPMEPPMKAYSITARIAGHRSISPWATSTASWVPTRFWEVLMRSV